MASERKFITENVRRVLLKEYMMMKVGRAGFGGLDIQRTPMGTRVTLITERPGLVIGRRGEAIKALTRDIEEVFKFSNPQIEVQEVQNPNLNAQIMAEKLANALERGWHFRRAGHSTVRRIMDSGARGCQVMIAGKLTGQRHRREKFRQGHIKYCGQAKLDFMEQGFAVAKMKPGIIGVTVQIMNPEARLPDEIDVLDLPPVTAPSPEEPSAEAQEVAEEKKAEEAVQELMKATDEPKEKKPRGRKKEAKPGATAAAADEKKPKKRKKKEGPAEEAAPASVAAHPEPPKSEAIEPAPTQAIAAKEDLKPLTEKPKEEEAPVEKKPAEEGKPADAKPEEKEEEPKEE